MWLKLPWVRLVGVAGCRGWMWLPWVRLAAVGEAGCRGLGWRTVWVRLAVVGQAGVLWNAIEKRSPFKGVAG